MPFTPFHFGPGAAICAIAPKHLSFWSFCGANILIDIEPLYYMLNNNPPLHRFFHTYVGATIVSIATIVLFMAGLAIAKRIALPNIFNWRALSIRAVIFGAFVGTYSHVVLDSFMHHDIAPLAPLSNGNHLLGLMPLGILHLLCVVAGIFAAAVIYMRATCDFSKTR
jgi:membrane-bound metal-dependent hydrolase YbcI (DUF457 family)